MNNENTEHTLIDTINNPTPLKFALFQGCGSSSCCLAEGTKKEIKEFDITIPADAKSGDIITITVGNNSLRPENAPANNLKDIIDNLKTDSYKSTDLIIRISTKDKVYYYKGRKLVEIPRSQLAKLLGEAVAWENTKFIDRIESTQYLLQHIRTIQVKIR